MKRVLIATMGSHGDVLPFIALAQEFARHGHHVILYANPFFKHYVDEAGVAFVPVGTVEHYMALFGSQENASPQQAFKRVAAGYAELCPAYYQSMRADVLAHHTVTIGSSLLFAHRLLRETDQVPCATVHLAPSVFRSTVQPARLVPAFDKVLGAFMPSSVKRALWWMMDKGFYDPLFTQPFNRFRTELGLPQVERIFQSWIHEADCVVGLFTQWFAPPQSDWPSNVALTGFPLYDHGTQQALSSPISAFLEAGAPPVVFSAGTATATAGEFFKTSIAAAQQAGMRAIVLSHFSEQIPAQLPDNVLHAAYAPFGALLPRASVFVHHGGIGSTSQALRAGVPQLIRPVAYDQFDNAQRAVQLGVGRELLPKHYSVGNVATSLRMLMQDGVIHEQCRVIAERFAHQNKALNMTYDTIRHQLSTRLAS